MDQGRLRGQSETIGYVLMIGLVVAGAGLVVAIGGAGLADTQASSEYQRAENSMTLFDSRAAMVALGDADSQTVRLGQDSGTIEVVEDAGWMRITHSNFTGESDSHVETIYNESLGKVVYERGDRRLAYQGGGVWSLDSDGAQAQMVSPPEFHYRGATLTLPTIRVRGDGSASGSVNLQVLPERQAEIIYPNRTSVTGNSVGAPYNQTASTPHRDYTNPVRNGTVNVTVNSEYADGWETYFQERTTGNTTRLGENTVRLTLETTTGPPGDFQMPNAGDSVRAGAIAGGHPLTEFDVLLDFEKNKPHFSFYAEEGSKEFEIHVYSDVNPKNNDCDPYGSEVYMSVYHYDGDGSKTYETWESDMVDPQDNDAFEWVCDGDDTKLRVDFISDDLLMTYDRIGQEGNFDPGIDDPNTGTSTGVTRGNKWAFNDRINDQDGFSLRTPTTWDQHEIEVGYEPENYEQNSTGTPDTEVLEEVTNHYLGAMDTEVDLIAKDGPGSSDSLNEDDSSGTLLYEEGAGADFVTYLHITRNEIRVST
jgi:hypothetical protein